jgi:hypothetical protein
LKVQKKLDATFRPILKMRVGQVFKSLLNFYKVVGEGFLENILCVFWDLYYLFKLKFNNNVANTSNMD